MFCFKDHPVDFISAIGLDIICLTFIHLLWHILLCMSFDAPRHTLSFQKLSSPFIIPLGVSTETNPPVNSHPHPVWLILSKEAQVSEWYWISTALSILLKQDGSTFLYKILIEEVINHERVDELFFYCIASNLHSSEKNLACSIPYNIV